MTPTPAYVDASQLGKSRQAVSQILETAAGGCGTSASPDDRPEEIWNKVKNHPCHSEEAHHHDARMHVAVAPACDIQCNYCNRK